ncbi:MAG TPA: hypothetical protein VMU15_16785 [Anaeromyxobacter sp.]|nr:hypothetical protein [Anaeromyxobacter sp.]
MAGASRTGPDRWFTVPDGSASTSGTALDLRSLNEREAGAHGRIVVKGGTFVRAGDSEPIRFWGVNLPLDAAGEESLPQLARTLASRGVNLVRVQGRVFDDDGEVDPARVRRAIAAVEAMKAEGIYTFLSIYFPLWFTPRAELPWLPGYDGHSHPFGAVFFDDAFGEHYRRWWTAVLTTPSPRTGRPLAEEPALAGIDLVNEDSLLFWTFDPKLLPERELRLVEQAFASWLERQPGGLPAARDRWGGLSLDRDLPREGRLALRPLGAIVSERTARDVDTARFLVELQTRFYRQAAAWVRELGFRGLIAASNWITASPVVLGPLEKLSYRAGDFIDRHGYFFCDARGPDSEWALRPGQTYADRSALRFDPEVPGGAKRLQNPVMDPHYDGMPSTLSEVTWNMPNRFRSEAPLYLAAYGALQHTDAVVHFEVESSRFTSRPGPIPQPWPLTSPAMLGQFPAAALIFRRGLVASGPVVARVDLDVDALFQLRGTPLPQDSPTDEQRPASLPSTPGSAAGPVDPLLHYAGRVDVRFANGRQEVAVEPSGSLVHRAERTVTSATGELKLDYGRGLLVIDAPRAQGVSGNLAASGPVRTRNVAFASSMDLAHLVLVSLDDQPIATSGRMLLQVMSEERTTGFHVEPIAHGEMRIVDLGQDPWQVRQLSGTVTVFRPDAADLRVTALDPNGRPVAAAGDGSHIELRPDVLYYLVSR